MQDLPNIKLIAQAKDSTSQSDNGADEFKYNLCEMLPMVTDCSMSDDEVTKKKRGKNLDYVSGDTKTKNHVVLEGPISKFIIKHNSLVKRYLVLNQYGLFVYKDDLAYKSFPQKPTVVIPL